MSYLSEYSKIFKELSPTLDEAEKKRKGLLRKFIVFVSILVIFFALTLVLTWVFMYKIPFCGGAIALLIFLLLFIIWISPQIINPIKEYKNYLKTNYMPKFVQCFENIKWSDGDDSLPFAQKCSGAFTESELVESNLFSTFNVSKFDDTFRGNYKGVDFKISEAELISKGDKNSKTAFKGVIISLPSNKKVTTNTIIATKNDKNIRNYPTGIIGTILLTPVVAYMWYLHFFCGVKLGDAEGYAKLIGMTIMLPIIIYGYLKQRASMQTVKLEDIKFDKRFDVFSHDQIEARYHLTPSFINRFTNLNTSFGASKAKCSFYKDSMGQDRIMFAISTNRDLFEIGNLFRTIKQPRYMFISELTSILNLIDYFRLDEKTGV